MKTIYTILMFISPFYIFSQSSNFKQLVPDERIIEVYGADYVERLLADNPFLIKRWNYYLDHAFYITEDIPDKGARYKEIEIPDLERINILKIEKEQDIERAWDVPKIYKIQSTDKLLIYHPGKLFNEKLRKALKQ